MSKERQHYHSLTDVFKAPDDQKPAESAPCLFVVRGPLAGYKYALDSNLTSLGRRPENEICVQAEGISKRHCSIIRGEDDNYYVMDEGSRNGTQLNGRQLDAHQRWQLAHGDMITLCDNSFFFLDPRSSGGGTESTEIRIDFDGAAKEAQDLLLRFDDLKALRRSRTR